VPRDGKTVALAPDDSEHPVPEFVGAAILNLRTDRYGFIPSPSDEAAHAAFCRLVDQATTPQPVALGRRNRKAP
jgi:hypothetical protein